MTDPGPRGTGSRVAWATLLSNSQWNFAAFGIVVLANFLTLPYVVQRLGIGDFGLGGLVLAVLAPLMFVGTVIGQACVRELSPLLAAQRISEARELLSSALCVCLGGSALVFAALAVGGAALIGHMAGPQAVGSVPLALVVPIAALGWVAQQFFLVLQATIVSTQQFRALAIVNVASALASAACLLLVTWIAPTVFGFLAGTSLGLFATLLLTWAQARRSTVHLFPLARPGRDAILRILAFGRWQVPAQLSGALALQADRYLLGATVSMPVVGQFNIATRLQEVVYMGVLKVSEVLFPHFSAGAAQPAGQQVSLFMTSSWLANAIAAAALAPLIPLGGVVIALWVGADAAELGGPMLRTLATAGIIGSGVNVFTYFAMGHGHTRRLGIMSMAHAATVVVASTVLVLGWGALAAAWGFVLANILRLLWATWITPGIVGGQAGIGTVLQVTWPPLVAGMLVGWAWPWSIATGSWILAAVQFVLVGTAVLVVALGLSAVLPASRTVVRGAVAGLRTHYLKR